MRMVTRLGRFARMTLMNSSYSSFDERANQRMQPIAYVDKRVGPYVLLPHKNIGVNERESQICILWIAALMLRGTRCWNGKYNTHG